MAVRDLFWGCPFCKAAGRIRKVRLREKCMECGATFQRGAAATIVGSHGRVSRVLSAAQWLEMLGPIRVPEPDEAGRILGPELVRVKRTTGQRQFYYGAAFLGWIETYDHPRAAQLELYTDGLHLRTRDGVEERWTLEQITGLQPASSTIQLGFRDHMVSIKFVEGSVRLWTAALSQLLHEFYERQGFEILVLQPHIRVCRAATSAT